MDQRHAILWRDKPNQITEGDRRRGTTIPKLKQPTQKVKNQLRADLENAIAGRAPWLHEIVLAVGYVLPLNSEIAAYTDEEWLSLPEAATLLNVSNRTLLRYCQGQRGLPILPHKRDEHHHNKYLVQPSTAYKYLITYAHDLSPNKPNYEPTQTGKPFSSNDPHAMLMEFLQNKSPHSMSNDDARTLKGIASELRIKAHAEEKEKRKIEREEALKYLRELSQAYVDAFEQRKDMQSRGLVEYILKYFNLDLLDKNVNAMQLLQRFEAQEFNALVDLVEQHIKEQQVKLK